MAEITRRQLLAAGLGAAGAVAAGGVLNQAWVLLGREDLVPGEPVERVLRPEAWETTEDHLSFAAIGDSGSGGRKAMAVADRMAQTYEVAPFGLVSLLGDICYYGSIEDRFGRVPRPHGAVDRRGRRVRARRRKRLACRLHVNAELRSSGLREVGPDTYGFTLTPALDESDQRQLHGCLEDTRIDHVQLAVARLENMVRSGNGGRAAPPLGGESTRRSRQFAR